VFAGGPETPSRARPCSAPFREPLAARSVRYCGSPHIMSLGTRAPCLVFPSPQEAALEIGRALEQV
jgi:hypothetical protein